MTGARTNLDIIKQRFASDIVAYESRIPTGIGLTKEAMMRSALDTVQSDPKLQACTVESIVSCALKGAVLGLTFGPALGHCYMIPFRNHGKMEATFVKGYRGILQILKRCGGIVAVEVDDVFTFEAKSGALRHTRGTGGGTVLTPDLEKRDELDVWEPANYWRELYAVMATFLLPDGQRTTHVMTRKRIEKSRNVSRAKSSGPWVDWPEEMSKKTVIAHGAKSIPWGAAISQTEIARAMAPDDLDPHSASFDVDFMAKDVQSTDPAPQSNTDAVLKQATLPAPPVNEMCAALERARGSEDDAVRTVVEGALVEAGVNLVNDLGPKHMEQAWRKLEDLS